MYTRLFSAFGPQSWWPGETPLEVSVGAVLTQNTAWTNVEKAIVNLKKAGLLPHSSLVARCSLLDGSSQYLLKLHNFPHKKLSRLIRPSGYFNIKAKRLKNFLGWVVKNYGNLKKMFQTPLDELRRQLLEVNGLGPETVDSILLYAGNQPTFVVDAYTKRVLSRHLLARQFDDYQTVKNLFEKNLPTDVSLYNEYHALFVRVGKELCKKKKPLCSQCPLEGFNWPRGVSVSSYPPKNF